MIRPVMLSTQSAEAFPRTAPASALLPGLRFGYRRRQCSVVRAAELPLGVVQSTTVDSTNVGLVYGGFN